MTKAALVDSASFLPRISATFGCGAIDRTKSYIHRHMLLLCSSPQHTLPCRSNSTSHRKAKSRPEIKAASASSMNPPLPNMQFPKTNVYYQKNAMLPIHRAGEHCSTTPSPTVPESIVRKRLHLPTNVCRSCIAAFPIYSDSTTESKTKPGRCGRSVTFLEVAPCHPALA